MSKKSLIDILPAMALEMPPPALHREWVTGREGKMYVRLCERMIQYEGEIRTVTSFDLATLGLRDCNQGKGVFTHIVGQLMHCNRQILYVENVQVGSWFEHALVRHNWQLIFPNSYWLPTLAFVEQEVLKV